MGVIVGWRVAVVVSVIVGMGVRVSVAVGIGVGVMGGLPPQADKKYIKITISKSVNFIRTQLYTQAV